MDSLGGTQMQRRPSGRRDLPLLHDDGDTVSDHSYNPDVDLDLLSSSSMDDDSVY
jgi:hypothetical protein